MTTRYRNPAERQLVTPEGLTITLSLASRGARFGALMLDLISIGAVIVVFTLLLVYLAGTTLETLLAAQQSDAASQVMQFFGALWIAAMFLLRNAWFLWFELGPRGATPGKRLTGIRIAARDGGRLTAEMVIARNLLRDIELFLPATFLLTARGGDMGIAGLAATAWFLIFAFFPFFNRDRLRAGDLIAGTWVVEAPRRHLEAVVAAAPPAASAGLRFTEAELAVYGEYELQTLERVLRDDRPQPLAEVHHAIARKIGRPCDPGEERAFLLAYYTQLRARLEGSMRMGQRKADKYDHAA